MTIQIPEEISLCLNVLHKNKYEAYVTGGAIRDSLLNRPVKDWDVTTSAMPQIIIDIFTKLGFKVLETGLKHGTVTVIINNMHIEITTFRSDGDYSDNRKPDSVQFGVTVEEDVKRRDFTINGLLYDGDKIIDYVGGLRDLKNKEIRCVGVAFNRFSEDKLRVMRCIRFACQLGFNICSQTYNAISFHAKDIVNISQERIRDELCKILLSDNPSKGIQLLADTGLLEYILPELCKCISFDQHNPHHDKNVFDHILKVLDNTPCSLNVRLSALFHDIGKPYTFSMDENNCGHFFLHHIVGADMTKDILKRLKFDNDTINNVSILVKEHMSRYPKLRKGTPKKLINRLGIHNIDDFINLQIADIIGSKPPFNFENIFNLKQEIKRVLEAKEPLSVKDLAINGYDLMEIGIKPSKEMGEILNYLLEFVLENPELNTKDDLLGYTKRLLEGV